MLRNRLLAVAALIAGLLLPAQAMAAYEAYTRADLNLRVGPATTYGIIDVIPYGEPVVVLGCLEDWYWCDIEWFGLRGWVAAQYLVQPGTSVYLPQFAPRVGLPIIGFSFYTYHERHYRDRPWYKKRSGRWRGRDWHGKRKRGGDRHWDGNKTDRAGKRIKRAQEPQEIRQPPQQRRTKRHRSRQEIQQPPQQQQIRRMPDRNTIRRAPDRNTIRRAPDRSTIRRAPDRSTIRRAPERRQMEQSPQRRQIKRSERSESSRRGQQRIKKRGSRRDNEEQPRRRRR